MTNIPAEFLISYEVLATTLLKFHENLTKLAKSQYDVAACAHALDAIEALTCYTALMAALDADDFAKTRTAARDAEIFVLKKNQGSIFGGIRTAING